MRNVAVYYREFSPILHCKIFKMLIVLMSMLLTVLYIVGAGAASVSSMSHHASMSNKVVTSSINDNIEASLKGIKVHGVFKKAFVESKVRKVGDQATFERLATAHRQFIARKADGVIHGQDEGSEDPEDQYAYATQYGQHYFITAIVLQLANYGVSSVFDRVSFSGYGYAANWLRAPYETAKNTNFCQGPADTVSVTELGNCYTDDSGYYYLAGHLDDTMYTFLFTEEECEGDPYEIYSIEATQACVGGSMYGVTDDNYISSLFDQDITYTGVR